MDALELPGAVPCPVCDAPLKRVLVAPVIDPANLFVAAEVVCPHCVTSYRIGADEMATDLVRMMRST